MKLMLPSAKARRGRHLLLWMVWCGLLLLCGSLLRSKEPIIELGAVHASEGDRGVVSGTSESVLQCASEAMIAVRQADPAFSYWESKRPLMHDCYWKSLLYQPRIADSASLATSLNQCLDMGSPVRPYSANDGEITEICESSGPLSNRKGAKLQCQRIEFREGKYIPSKGGSRSAYQLERPMDVLVRFKNSLTLDEFTTAEIHCVSFSSTAKSCVGVIWTFVGTQISLRVQYTTTAEIAVGRIVARLQSLELPLTMQDSDASVAKTFGGDFLNLFDLETISNVRSNRLPLDLLVVVNDQESSLRVSVPLPCRSLKSNSRDTRVSPGIGAVSVDFSWLRDIGKKNKVTRALPRREIKQIPAVVEFLRTKHVYISLTTSPHRLRLIHHVLETLDLSLISGIFIALPFRFGKHQVPYYFPANFEERLGVPVPIHILRPSEDTGPMTKLLATVQYVRDVLNEPDSIIITVDDDTSYPWGTINELILASVTNPDSIAGLSVHPATKWGVPTQSCLWSQDRQLFVAEGFGGVAYRAKHVDDQFMLASLSAHKLCFVSDDLVIAYGICRQGVRVELVKNEYTSREVMEQFEYGWLADALHHGAGVPDGFKDSMASSSDVNSYKYQMCAQAINNQHCKENR